MLLKVINGSFILTLLCILSGCANTSHYYDPTQFSNEKGVVIVRITQNAPLTLNNTNIGLNYNLKKVGQNEVYNVNGNNSFLPGISNEIDYSTGIMMLDPGIYYINYISLNTEGNLRRWFPGPGLKTISNKESKKYLISMGAFEVKAGKVTYFGHLNLSKSGTLPFNVINETEKVKSDLRKNGLTDLANKVEFGTFNQKGSVLIEKNGKATFISSEEINNRINKQLDDITKSDEK